jgi:hypothetical protein
MRAGMDDVRGKPMYLKEIKEILKDNIIME